MKIYFNDLYYFFVFILSNELILYIIYIYIYIDIIKNIIYISSYASVFHINNTNKNMSLICFFIYKLYCFPNLFI